MFKDEAIVLIRYNESTQRKAERLIRLRSHA
jgi:hypothetical protein